MGGEMGPFLDAINSRGCSDDEGGDDELPDSTVAGSGSCRDTNNVDNADQFRESYRLDIWITMQTGGGQRSSGVGRLCW